MVGSSEVDLHSGELFDVTVAMKLCAVVSGDGVEEVRGAVDDVEETVVESVDGMIAELADENAASDSLNEGQDAMFAAGSCYCIDLPMTDLFAVFNDSGAL